MVTSDPKRDGLTDGRRALDVGHALGQHLSHLPRAVHREGLHADLRGERAVEPRQVPAAPRVQHPEPVLRVPEGHLPVGGLLEPVVHLVPHLVVQRSGEEHHGDVPVWVTQVHRRSLLREEDRLPAAGDPADALRAGRDGLRDEFLLQVEGVQVPGRAGDQVQFPGGDAAARAERAPE